MSADSPLVSIGMPVHNGEKYLRRSLDSLLAQEYDNFELIVSDNASSDASQSICREYADRDHRIKLFFQDQNHGAQANFIFVLEQSTGEYFMWAACDDIWRPGFVNAQVIELRKNPESFVSMSTVKRVRESGKKHDIVRFSGKKLPTRMSYRGLALALAGGKPYHLFVYGLYVKDFLTAAVKDFPRVAGGDRLFVTQVALATRFSYVDKVLHVRQVHEVPLRERFADEDLGRQWRSRISSLRMVIKAGPYLLTSDIIPYDRKLWIPMIVIRLAIWQIWANSKSVARKILCLVGLEEPATKLYRFVARKS